MRSRRSNITAPSFSRRRGQYSEAEKSFTLAEQRRRASFKGILSGTNPPPEVADCAGRSINLVLGEARMKAKQGRLAEAEADARRALLSRLKDHGKYNPATTNYIVGLANILVDEGRYAEAETLMRTALDINRTIGVADDSQTIVHELSGLAMVLNLQHKRKEAIAVYAEIDKATANWDPQRRQALDLNGSRINSYYAAGQIRPRHRGGAGSAQARNRPRRREKLRYRQRPRQSRVRLHEGAIATPMPSANSRPPFRF